MLSCWIQGSDWIADDLVFENCYIDTRETPDPIESSLNIRYIHIYICIGGIVLYYLFY